MTSKQCKSTLRSLYCTPRPPAWNVAQLYEVAPNDPLIGEGATAEFLLTRGDYAWLGYGWVGCSAEVRPRPAQWDRDYGGEPVSPHLHLGCGVLAL